MTDVKENRDRQIDELNEDLEGLKEKNEILEKEKGENEEKLKQINEEKKKINNELKISEVLYQLSQEELLII